ncbi:MAG: Txe/YoeB family addiction module toxin [Treponema sp.]|nr:Txe/YoeB family addiction module toxin [Treponema sp.]
MYKIIYSSQAQRDAKKVDEIGLKSNIQKIINILQNNPYQNPPPYEKLIGDLSDSYSRRINIQHRLIYQVYRTEKIVKIIRMWTHYE